MDKFYILNDEQQMECNGGVAPLLVYAGAVAVGVASGIAIDFTCKTIDRIVEKETGKTVGKHVADWFVK